MSRVKIYLPLLALSFIVGACGGGNGGGGNSTNNTPASNTLSLNENHRNLLQDVQELIAPTDSGNGETQRAASPIVARNESESTFELLDVNDNSALRGKYYAVFSNTPYEMNKSERNKFENPTLVREPGNTELGKLGLTVGTNLEEDIEIVMLFNSDGNAVIALSSFDDFVAGGSPLVSAPTGNFRYSGKNYYKIDDRDIGNGEFVLTVNFDGGTGEFESGLSGRINLDSSKGSYTGDSLTMNVGDTSYSLNEIKGQFHGDDQDSSVTGLYRGGTENNSEIKGAIIGTSNRVEN